MDIEIGMPTPDVITQNIGSSCALSDLQAAYDAQDCEQGGDCIVGFNCQSQVRGHNTSMAVWDAMAMCDGDSSFLCVSPDRRVCAPP
jgi:hypothetical protein